MRTIILTVAAVLAAPAALAQSSAVSEPARATELMARAAREKGEKQVQTYIEACEAGAASACTKAGVLGRNIDRRRYILTKPQIASLLERGCRFGGEAECAAAAAAGELNATWRIGLDGRPEQTSPALRYDMAVFGCERGSASLCAHAGDIAFAGNLMPPDFDAASEYYAAACRLGEAQACGRDRLLKGADAAALKLAREKARLTWLGKSYAYATNLPDDHPARAIYRKKFGTSDRREQAQFEYAACQAGDPQACAELGFALELHISHDYVPAGVRRADILRRGCALGSPEACVLAARDHRKFESGYTYYTDSADLYRRACTDMGNMAGCVQWGEWIEAEGDIDADAQLVRTLYRNDCLVRNAMDRCERLDAFEQKMTPERVAARLASRQTLLARNRVMPWAAYGACAGPESVALGQAIDGGNAQAGFERFVRRCGGQYAKPQLTAACATLDGRPEHHRLLCAGVLVELKGNSAIAAGDWQVTGEALDEHFRLWPFEDYLDRANTAHIANALDPNGPVRMSGVAIAHASLFPEIAGQAELRTAVGDSVFRMVLQDRGFVILSPVDPANTIQRNGVYSFYVFPDGTAPADWNGGRGNYSTLMGARRMEHRAAWDEAAGKWIVETASYFEIPDGSEWQAIAQGNLYAFLPSGIQAAEGSDLCCKETLYIPFRDGRLSAHALQRTEMARLYGGTITPDVAEAMRVALNDSPQGSLWYDGCGERPYVSTAGMGRDDFDNAVDDFSLQRERNALNRRVAWYNCQAEKFNASHADLRAFVSIHKAKSPTDPMRWRAALMLSRHEARRGKLLSEADTLDSYAETIGEATSAYNSAQRARLRREREERRAAEANRPSAADEFYYRNSGAYYADCLAGAQSYGQQQGCMDQWFANTGSASRRNAGGAVDDDSDYGLIPEAVLTAVEMPAVEAREPPVSRPRNPVTTPERERERETECRGISAYIGEDGVCYPGSSR